MSTVKHTTIFNKYAVGTHVKICQNNRVVDRTPTQQNQGTVGRTDMQDSSWDFDVRSDAPKDMMTKSSQDSRNGQIRTRSGWIGHRPESLGIDI